MAHTHSFILTLVRHGQTSANKSFIVQGQQDVPLSDNGRNQAERLGAHFRQSGADFDTVFSSDLSRALETCEIVVRGLGVEKEIVVDDRLRERGYGVVEGQSLQELRAAAKAAGFNDKNYSCFIPTGAESLEQVRTRIQDFCSTRLVAQATPGQKVLLVTHGGVIREFMRFFRDQLKCQLTGLKEPLRVTPNTGVSSFCVSYKPQTGEKPQQMVRAECLSVHDVSHLESTDFWNPADDLPAVQSNDSQAADRPGQTTLPVGEPLEAL